MPCEHFVQQRNATSWLARAARMGKWLSGPRRAPAWTCWVGRSLAMSDCGFIVTQKTDRKWSHLVSLPNSAWLQTDRDSKNGEKMRLSGWVIVLIVTQKKTSRKWCHLFCCPTVHDCRLSATQKMEKSGAAWLSDCTHRDINTNNLADWLSDCTYHNSKDCTHHDSKNGQKMELSGWMIVIIITQKAVWLSDCIHRDSIFF